MTDSAYRRLIFPLLKSLDPETAHDRTLAALAMAQSNPAGRAMLRAIAGTIPMQPVQVGKLRFPNPLGVAAGLDKNAVVVDRLASIGFGFVEVGTVTLEPQKGNDKPRLFRLPQDHALINRLGFNNDGAARVAARLRKVDRKCVIGVNIGKNKDVPNEEAAENYLKSFDLVYEAADYIAVNISSPNTPNLRELQRSERLEELLGLLQARNRELANAGSSESAEFRIKPLLVKIAPDLSENEIGMIVDICLRLKIDGIIATNTTVSRDGLKTANVNDLGPGGLSGKPLSGRSNEVIRTIFRHSKGKLPIIGVGGIFTGQDAFDKIAAGACLVQAYTGFVYGGPSFARDVNAELARLIKARGFVSVDEVVGSDSGHSDS